MSTTVTAGGFEHESSSETAAQMVETLKPKEETSKQPVVVKDKGKAVEPEQAKASEAARELGKRGGEAAAKAREQRAKQVKVAPDEGESEGKVAPEAPEREAKPAEEVKAKETEPAEPERDKKGHPRHDPQARIEQLARERGEERRRNDELAARLERLETELRAKSAPPSEAKPKDADAEPKLDDYAEYDDYVRAVARHTAKQEAIRLRQEAQAEQQAQEQAKAKHESRTAFLKRLDAYPDQDALTKVDERLTKFVPVSELEPGDSVGPDNLIGEFIKKSERPVEAMLHLSQHPEEVIRLLQCGPWDLPMELGKLEARFGQVEEPERKYTPAAPPLKPLTGTAQVPEVDIMDPNLSFDRFMGARKRRA